MRRCSSSLSMILLAATKCNKRTADLANETRSVRLLGIPPTSRLIHSNGL